MKKCLLAFLFVLPITVFAAPSVKVLGAKNTGTAQVVPAKTSNAAVKDNQSASVRVGTLRNKQSSSGPSGVLTSNGSRFPVITSTKTYNSVTQPGVGDKTSPYGGSGISDAKVNEIIDTVTDRVNTTIINNYYDKTEVYTKNEVYNKDEVYNKNEVYNKDEVYNNNEFINAVKDIDDPRIDAIRTRNPANLHSAELPEDYIYVWIEQ